MERVRRGKRRKWKEMTRVINGRLQEVKEHAVINLNASTLHRQSENLFPACHWAPQYPRRGGAHSPPLSPRPAGRLISDLECIFCGPECAPLKKGNSEIHAAPEYERLLFAQ